MKNNIKIMVVSLGLLIAASSVLTACHTVEGTIQGAGQGASEDINSVSGGGQAEPMHHKMHHHHKAHKMHKKSKMSNSKEMDKGSTSKENMNQGSTNQNNMSNPSY